MKERPAWRCAVTGGSGFYGGSKVSTVDLIAPSLPSFEFSSTRIVPEKSDCSATCNNCCNLRVDSIFRVRFVSVRSRLWLILAAIATPIYVFMPFSAIIRPILASKPSFSGTLAPWGEGSGEFRGPLSPPFRSFCRSGVRLGQSALQRSASTSIVSISFVPIFLASVPVPFQGRSARLPLLRSGIHVPF